MTNGYLGKPTTSWSLTFCLNRFFSGIIFSIKYWINEILFRSNFNSNKVDPPSVSKFFDRTRLGLINQIRCEKPPHVSKEKHFHQTLRFFVSSQVANTFFNSFFRDLFSIFDFCFLIIFPVLIFISVFCENKIIEKLRVFMLQFSSNVKKREPITF